MCGTTHPVCSLRLATAVRATLRGRSPGAGWRTATLQAMANHRVTIIPGDGIGPEVAAATRLVLDAADVGIEWVEMPAGAGALETRGALLPAETVDAIRSCRVAIKGPITTPVGTGFRSVNVALRQGLDLFAAVRPARSLPGVHDPARRRRPRDRPGEHRGPVPGDRVRTRLAGDRRAQAAAPRRRRAGAAGRRGHHAEADQRDRRAPDRAVRVRVRALDTGAST